MHVSFGRFAAPLLALAALSGAASAEPPSVASVRAALESVGVEKTRSAILYGQPMLSAELQGLGFVAGLRRCVGDVPDPQLCEEVALKACLPLAETNDRVAMLEAANRFNLNRYGGTLTIDKTGDLGPVVCTVVRVSIDDDNSFGLDEAYQWSQALTDFLSFIMDEKMNLRGFSLL